MPLFKADNSNSLIVFSIFVVNNSFPVISKIVAFAGKFTFFTVIVTLSEKGFGATIVLFEKLISLVESGVEL